jgi:hypothetical protein
MKNESPEIATADDWSDAGCVALGWVWRSRNYPCVGSFSSNIYAGTFDSHTDTRATDSHTDAYYPANQHSDVNAHPCPADCHAYT